MLWYDLDLLSVVILYGLLGVIMKTRVYLNGYGAQRDYNLVLYATYCLVEARHGS